MSRKLPFAFALLAPLVLATGCAGPQDCDPSRDRSIFQVAGCVGGGGYTRRVEQLSRQASAAEADRANAETDRAAAEGRRDRAAAQAARLRGDLAGQQARSIAFERDMATARQRTRVDQQRLGTLEQDLATLRADQDRLRAAPPSPESSQRLQEMRQRQESLEGQWDRLRAAAPRE